MKKLLVLLILLAGMPPLAADTFPPAQWRDAPNPIAGPDAYVGGEISIFAGQYPKSLNYYLDNSTQASEIFGNLYETLLSIHPVTLADEPSLAARWQISKDKKTFTFYLDKTARWSDGSPITAEDVRWTYDTIMNPKNLTGVHKVSLETFHPPKIIDRYTIQFTAREIHWRNLRAAGGFQILPKKAFAGKDFNKINFEFPVISGRYKVGQINEGVSIKLERRDDYWDRKSKRAQNTSNFQTLKYNFMADRNNAWESFKKGGIDLFPVYTARRWIKDAKGPKFDNNWIVKQRVYNHRPMGFQGFAMNMRKAPFDDVRVRKAMAHLVDREKMNRTIMYNQYFMHKSYYEHLYSKKHPCPNPVIRFDKQKARELLKQAGWIANPKTGWLEKNGRSFAFRFLTRDPTSDKFIAIFAEDLKDVGIKLTIDRKDWAAWVRDMDEFNYQMTWAAWSAGIFPDPEGMWASKEARRKSGNNITGFESKKVDALIEKQKSIFDVQKRNAIVREVDQLIYKEFPYILLWNIDYKRLLYWNKFGTPEWVLSKFGDESAAYAYWWLDEDSAADLAQAQIDQIALPPRDATIYFDELFAQ